MSKNRDENRSREEILEHVRGLLYAGRSLAGLSTLERAEGPIRIIPTGCNSSRLESMGIKLHEVSVDEANMMARFLEKITCVDEMVMVLANLDTGGRRLVMPKDGSKYFPEGRKRIKRKIERKMTAEKAPGRMITLTYDPLRVKREVAWRQCGKHVSALIDMIKVYLKRKRGIAKIQYFWVIEEQAGTGYPHFHLFIQDDSENGKAGYLPAKLVKRWWGLGGVHVKAAAASIRHYITKYIGKVTGFSVLAMAHMWQNKRRLYGFSRVYIVAAAEVNGKKYGLIGMFHPVKGFGIAEDGGYYWVGGCPVSWLLGDPKEVENWGSAGHEVILNRLWADDPQPEVETEGGAA